MERTEGRPMLAPIEDTKPQTNKGNGDERRNWGDFLGCVGLITLRG